MTGSILVVEDEPVTRKLIVANLERSGYAVVLAAGVPQAEKAINEALPDLVLLDWILPDGTGLGFARKLRAAARTRDIPIIMLTTRGDEADKVMGLESGADDYITKPFSSRELVARIKALMRRRAPMLSDDVVEVDGLLLDPAAHRITGRGLKIELGVTEFRMLHFFMTHPDRVYSRAQLLDEVWGDHVFIEERTVDVHIRKLRQALQPAGLEDMLETVRGIGYRFRRIANYTQDAAPGLSFAPLGA